MYGLRNSDASIDSLLFGDARECVESTRDFLRRPDASEKLEKVAQVAALVYVGAKILSSFCDRDY